MKNLLLYFFLSHFLIGVSQNRSIDSLSKLLETAQPDSVKVSILDNLSWEFIGSDFDKALLYAKEELELSRKINYMRGVSGALINMGRIAELQGDLSTALKYYLECLKLNEQTGNKRNIISSYINIANVYTKLQDHHVALEYKFKSLKLTRTLLDSSNLKNKYTFAAVYANIGASYSYLENYQEALKYDAVGLDFLKSIGDKASIAGAYNNIGVAYSNLKKYKKALECYNHSLRLAEEINSPVDIASTTISVGRLYKSQDKHEKAIAYFQKALTYPYVIKNDLLRLNVYQCLAESFEALKDHKNQNVFLLRYIALNDSIFTEEKSTELATLQAKFKTDEKEKENIILSKQNQIQSLELSQKTNTIWGLGILFSFIAIIAWLFFKQNKLKSQQKAIQLEQKLLRLQMNPHFIFNSLTAIESFIYEKQPEEAGKYLSDFSRLMRMVLENSREERITLEQEVNTLTSFLRLQQLNLEDTFSYSINVDENLNIEKIKVPPMLFQPFVENAIKHGCADVEHGHVSVSFKQKENSLIIEIADNGKGIQAEKRSKTHKSLATTITKERLSIINSKAKVIYFEIADNFPVGTKVNFNIPIG